MASAIGLYPKANISEKQIIAMEHTGMEKIKVDFALEYKNAEIYFMQGLLSY